MHILYGIGVVNVHDCFGHKIRERQYTIGLDGNKAWLL